MKSKRIWILLLILALALMVQTLYKEYRTNPLGPNNQNTEMEIGKKAHFEISQYPDWNFSKVRINLSAKDKPLYGTLKIQGRVDTLQGHWFKSISVEQKTHEPLELVLENEGEATQVQIQWWVEN